MKRTFLLLFASGALAQTIFVERFFKAKIDWAALSATGQTPSVDVSTVAPVRHTLSGTITGSPTTCTLKLEGSLDNTTWFDLSGSQSCTANFMFHVVDRHVDSVRVNLTALSGGTSPTVTLKYMGKP